MKFTKEDLEREFICPKCRNHGGVVQEVDLGRSVAGLRIPLMANYYWALACGLCGYTEFYQLAVLEKSGAEEGVHAGKLAEKTE